MRKFDLSLRSSRSSYFATFLYQLTILSKTDALDEEKCLNMLRTFVKNSFIFPYTTLFRSYPLLLATPDRFVEGESMGVELKSESAYSDKFGDPGTEDRKSTRLNSSHDQTSYAVFCSKKNKLTILSKTDALDEEKWLNMLGT